MSDNPKSSLEILVCDDERNIVSNARVTVKKIVPGSDLVILRFDANRHVYSTNLEPDSYLLEVEAIGYEPGRREIKVDSAGRTDTFVVGREGMLFYYAGNVKVPFEPRYDLLAIAVKAGLTKTEEEDLREYVHTLKLEFENISQSLVENNVRVLRFKPTTQEGERTMVQSRLSDNNLVLRVGPLVRFTKDSLSFLTNELIVKFRPNVTQEEITKIVKKFKLEIIRTIPYAGNTVLVTSRTQATYDILQICDQIVQTGQVEYAEPNRVSTITYDFIPNDPRYPDQPHHHVLASEGGWDVTLGSNSIIMAVVDNGCDLSHLDFSSVVGKIYKPFNFLGMNTILLNTDGLGAIDSHGTQSTGIAGAITNNSVGISGLAGDCRIMPIRRPNISVSGSTDIHVCDMYIWIAGFDPHTTTMGFPVAISPGADVISNSYGVNNEPLTGIMKDTFDYLTTYGRAGKGCIVVFSVGNGNTDFTLVRTWAAYEKTISVAASSISPPDASEIKIGNSNFGNTLDVCAPGGGWGPGEHHTLSTTNGGGYADFGETSAACPMVAGVAALILSINSHLTWIEVRQILRDTATKIDVGSIGAGIWRDASGRSFGDPSYSGPYYSKWYGYGRVNAQAAVNAASAYVNDRDIVVRENLADTGGVPSAGTFYDSPDIWVRNMDPASDGAGALPATYGDMPPHQNAISGQPNWVYVRIKNRGMLNSYDFYVRVYVTHWAGLEFIYHDNFIPTDRPGMPIPSPMRPGTYLIGEVHCSSLAAGSNNIVNVLWPSSLIPPEIVTIGTSPVSWHPCILVEISPHDGLSSTGNHVWDDNNIAQKNITIEYMKGKHAFANFAVVGNIKNNSKYVDLMIDRSDVPENVRIYVKFLDSNMMNRMVSFSNSSVTKGNSSKYEFKLGNHGGEDVIWVDHKDNTCIPIFTQGNFLVPIIIGGVAEQTIESGKYELKLIQLNPDGRQSGALLVQLNFGK